MPTVSETLVKHLSSNSSRSFASPVSVVLRPESSRPAQVAVSRSLAQARPLNEANSKAGRRPIGREYVLQFWRTTLPLVLADLFLLTVGITVARQVIFSLGGATGLDISACFWPIATGFVIIGAELGLYPGVRLSPVEEFRRVIVAVTAMFGVWTMGIAILADSFDIQRWFLLLAWATSVVCLTACRGTARKILGQCKWWGFPTFICGNDSAAFELHQWLGERPQMGLRSAGVIGNASELGVDGNEAWYAGDWSAIETEARDRHAYWALVIPEEETTSELAHEVASCLTTLPHVQVLSATNGIPDHWGGTRPVDGLAGTHFQQNLLLPGPRFAKRMLDLVIASAVVIALLPVLAIVAACVKLTSRGPVLFGHTRLGHDGQQFKAWKFRTMVTNSDEVLKNLLANDPDARAEWEKDQKLRQDPRITIVGRLFRKTSLDELPQLWNVLRGDMSLVGPRPIVSSEIEKYGNDYWLYTTVKPGITGLWQVSGRNNTTYDERVELDAYYVRNWSPWLDAYLLLRTVRTVVLAEGAY